MRTSVTTSILRIAVWLTLLVLILGQVRTGDIVGRGHKLEITRLEQPVIFWTVITIQLVLMSMLALGILGIL